MRRYEYEQTSHRLGDARADNGAVFVASEAVAKLSGLHYMSYDCVPVASPGAGTWTRLVLRASRIFFISCGRSERESLDTLSRAKECNNYCCRSSARYAN